jgi:acetylornithine deacetylase/succinyl-diaminopimelate desuccinylase-like protein
MSWRTPNRRPAVQLIICIAWALAAATGLEAQQLTREQLEAATEAQVLPALELYRDILSFPNDAHFPEDMRRVIDRLDAAFTKRGFETSELETGRIPLLLAERSFPGAPRTVLFYLQSDGQPVSPEHWYQDDPYEAVLKENTNGEWREIPWERLLRARNSEWRIFARSASDSKGPIVQFLSALDAMERLGFPPDFNIKVIIDTEEELGSPPLPAAVERYSDRLKFGARGIATFTLTTYGPRVPIHSGHYGNYAPNPALRLAQILASMKDENGRVTIPGFYDGVKLDAETKRILARVPDDETAIRATLGIGTVDQIGTTLQEAVQYPSLNIRGMSSGWVGEQRRTIVPATATAEVDVRLVMESDPERLLRLIRSHIEGLGYFVIEREPTDAERRAHPKSASFTSEISYLAFRTDFDSEPGRWLSSAFENLYGEEPIKIRTSGGSIPISPFVTTLDVPAVSVPTVNPDNNQHSPNENIRLGNFIEGIKVCLAVLAQDF